MSYPIKKLDINDKQTITFRKHNLFIGLSGSRKMEIMKRLQYKYIPIAMVDRATKYPTLLYYPENGLDYNQIHKLCDEIKESKQQYFIVTHNRDIINQFELEDLFIFDENNIYCNDNNKENIDEFAFTGLNNYDFYRSDFYKDESKSIEILRF